MVTRLDEIERLILKFCEDYHVKTCEIEFKGKAKVQNKQKYKEMDCLFG